MSNLELIVFFTLLMCVYNTWKCVRLRDDFDTLREIVIDALDEMHEINSGLVKSSKELVEVDKEILAEFHKITRE